MRTRRCVGGCDDGLIRTLDETKLLTGRSVSVDGLEYALDIGFRRCWIGRLLSRRGKARGAWSRSGEIRCRSGSQNYLGT